MWVVRTRVIKQTRIRTLVLTTNNRCDRLLFLIVNLLNIKLVLATSCQAAVYVVHKGILAGDENVTLTRTVAIAFAATGGTSFRGADLTDADFTQAILKNTDFIKANLTRTRFYEARKLNLARVGDSILANQAVLNLLIRSL